MKRRLAGPRSLLWQNGPLPIGLRGRGRLPRLSDYRAEELRAILAKRASTTSKDVTAPISGFFSATACSTPFRPITACNRAKREGLSR